MIGFCKGWFGAHRHSPLRRPRPIRRSSRLNLARCRPGQTVKVVRIDGGWGIRQRLGQIGIHIGDELVVVRGGPFGGPVLISVHNSRVAIGRGMARKIRVDSCESS